VPTEFGGSCAQVRPGDHDQPGHHQAAREVRGQGHEPQAQQPGPGPTAGYPCDGRDQEVLREQLAAGQQQRDEPDREHRGGQQRLPRLLINNQIGQDADADIDTAHEAGRYERDQRPGQPVAALGYKPAEGLFDFRFAGSVPVLRLALLILRRGHLTLLPVHPGVQGA
jgi:hypothetical protein